jgi:serine-type D-Ala-D-Ala carboxypeptidase/endopeptidase
VETEHNDELVVKDGGTGGYATFIGYSARTGIAAVLLSKTASWIATPRSGPPSQRESSIADTAPAGANRYGETDAYTGRYPLTQRFVLTVTPKDGHLMVQATGQEEYEVFRKATRASSIAWWMRRSPSCWHPAEPPLVLHQNGRHRRGIRSP